MQLAVISVTGDTRFHFSDDIAVPDMWQYVNYGETFRFIIKAPDGSETLGVYRPPTDMEIKTTRNLVNMVRGC
jgi:hypothetical protein